MIGHVVGHVTGQIQFGHVTFPWSHASEVPKSQFMTSVAKFKFPLYPWQIH
jgi:hypothetical protein